MYLMKIAMYRSLWEQSLKVGSVSLSKQSFTHFSCIFEIQNINNIKHTRKLKHVSGFFFSWLHDDEKGGSHLRGAEAVDIIGQVISDCRVQPI